MNRQTLPNLPEKRRISLLPREEGVILEPAEMLEIHGMFRQNAGGLSVTEFGSNGKLPNHVKVVTSKGRRYYYFRTGQFEDGREALEKLPDIGLRQFAHEYAVALAKRENRPAPVWVRPDRTYVYFIGGDVGAIKIGWAREPKLRLSGIQTGSPIPLAILATVEGGRKLEREYHARFAASRLHGEWFERTPELLAEIERIGGR